MAKMKNQLESVWTNLHTSLFLIRSGFYPEWLQACHLANVSMIDQDRSFWVCSHCGSFVKNRLSCPSCNAPMKAAQSGCGFIELHGLLPFARPLDDLDSDFTIQISRIDCGAYNDPMSGQAIIIADNCKVREKCIEGFSAIFGREPEDDPLVLCLLISCDVRLNFEETQGIVFDWSLLEK